MDQSVLELCGEGGWPEFLAMLPDYARLCQGECAMIDTATLLVRLGVGRLSRPR
jgi:3,4-dihydroxyphenylacetate 2,3-dioxygenase